LAANRRGRRSRRRRVGAVRGGCGYPPVLGDAAAGMLREAGTQRERLRFPAARQAGVLSSLLGWACGPKPFLFFSRPRTDFLFVQWKFF
jgi:hypothetical protein